METTAGHGDRQSLTPQQIYALGEEARVSSRLIHEGIVAVWKLGPGNDFFHLPMQLLSQGFERMLKLTYALAYLNVHGKLPKRQCFKFDLRHNLQKTTELLVDIVSQQDAYTSKPAVQGDLEFIRNSSDLDKILKLLSTFGGSSRYHRFDEFLDPGSVNEDDDPDRQWQAIEMEVLKRQPDWWSKLQAPQPGDIHRQIAREIVCVLERFARAVARMWTLGAVDEEGRRHIGSIKKFLFLRDEELGRQRD